MNNEYQIDDVCKFLDKKDMKKVNSYIENYKPENGGLDMAVRIKVDDYTDKGNTRIIRKSTILGVSIIKKGNEGNE